MAGWPIRLRGARDVRYMVFPPDRPVFGRFARRRIARVVQPSVPQRRHVARLSRATVYDPASPAPAFRRYARLIIGIAEGIFSDTSAVKQGRHPSDHCRHDFSVISAPPDAGQYGTAFQVRPVERGVTEAFETCPISAPPLSARLQHWRTPPLSKTLELLDIASVGKIPTKYIATIYKLWLTSVYCPHLDKPSISRAALGEIWTVDRGERVFQHPAPTSSLQGGAASSDSLKIHGGGGGEFVVPARQQIEIRETD